MAHSTGIAPASGQHPSPLHTLHIRAAGVERRTRQRVGLGVAFRLRLMRREAHFQVLPGCLRIHPAGRSTRRSDATAYFEICVPVSTVPPPSHRLHDALETGGPDVLNRSEER